MQTSDRTLDQFLYHNRISPPPEFSARVDAFGRGLEQQGNCNRQARRDTRKERARKKAFRWLMPAAVILAAIIIAVSVPSVSKAVGNWLAGVFRLEEYMAVEPDQRENNSELEAAVQNLIPLESKATIQFLDETEFADGVNRWRKENGYSEFHRETYAWVNDLNPKVNELLYDGRTLVVNTVLTADPKRFIGMYSGDGERFDVWTNSVKVLVNGEEYTSFSEQNSGLMLRQYYDTDDPQGFDMDKVNKRSTVTEQTTLIGNQSPAFPSGPVTVIIEMWLMDGAIDDMGTVGLAAIITQTLTFDASEGNDKLGSTDVVTQMLAGTAPITIHRDDGSIENEQFDFSCVSVQATVTHRTTGIHVALHYSFANGELEQAYWDAIVPGATGGHGLQYEAFVDGRSIGKVWHTAHYLGLRDDPVIEIPLTESELANVQSIVLRPWVRYMSSYSIDGELYVAMPMDKRLYLNSFSDYYRETVLKNCDILIPLP